LSAQAIPITPDLLQVSAYKDFLKERRKRVAEVLNGYLESANIVANS